MNLRELLYEGAGGDRREAPGCGASLVSGRNEFGLYGNLVRRRLKFRPRELLVSLRLDKDWACRDAGQQVQVCVGEVRDAPSTLRALREDSVEHQFAAIHAGSVMKFVVCELFRSFRHRFNPHRSSPPVLDVAPTAPLHSMNSKG